jgi:hypothetical protein
MAGKNLGLLTQFIFKHKQPYCTLLLDMRYMYFTSIQGITTMSAVSLRLPDDLS